MNYLLFYYTKILLNVQDSFSKAEIKYAVRDITQEEIYYIPKPALGLWINREAFGE